MSKLVVKLPWFLALLLCALAAAACDDDNSSPDADAGDADVADGDLHDADGQDDAAADADADEATDADQTPEIDPDPDCDPLVPTHCALPWPSSHFLAVDEGSPTGYHLAFGETTLPRTISGDRPPREFYARFDGYSVGSLMMTHLPGLDASSLPNELELAQTLEDDSPVLLVEVSDEGQRRVPCWAEIDQRADDEDPPALFIRAGEILRNGARYVVALRDLVDEGGEPLEPSPAFRLLRDGEAADHPVLGERAGRFEEIFSILTEEGVDRSDLVLAWDFVTASRETSQGDMLAIRDQAYELVGDDGPELTITDIEEFAPADDGSGRPIDAEISHRILGTFRVPLFMEDNEVDGETGQIIHRDDDGLPRPNGWVERTFAALIPHDDGSGRDLELVEYGHGLTASYERVFSGTNQRIALEEQVIYFGASLTGFSTNDTETIVGAVTRPQQLPWFTELIPQGVMEYVVLARAMQRRFPELPEITGLGRAINDSRVSYSGISQGGIYGATVVALSQEMLRGHLGVPGNNYGLLLERSVDFNVYLALIQLYFPRRLDQPLVIESVVNLWQMTDPVNYYRQIAHEPFSDTPAHAVLLAQAQGDWQVAPLTNEIAVRSETDVALMEHYGRLVPLVDEVPYPHVGSALVNYAFGDPWAPPGNLPPPETERDPHQLVRNEDNHTEQMFHFLRTGEVIDVCGGDECTPQ